MSVKKWHCPSCGQKSNRMDVWGCTCQNMLCDVRAFRNGEINMKISPGSSMEERALYKGLDDGSNPSPATNQAKGSESRGGSPGVALSSRASRAFDEARYGQPSAKHPINL